MSRKLLILALVTALTGCQLARPFAQGMPTTGNQKERMASGENALPRTTLVGRVDFPSTRSNQALPSDVVTGSTVSFFDVAGNTVATGKTDGAGTFTLVMSGFSPSTSATYVLEAVKGLNANAPGSTAARFRTILQWNGSGWLSMTNPSVGGSIAINAQTTALAIDSALDPINIAPAQTIGKVNLSTNPPSFTAGFTNHPASELDQLTNDLLANLSANLDPVSSIPAVKPTLTAFTPTSGPVGSLVQFTGMGFSPTLTGNTVKFNGTQASVVLASNTQIVAVVPVGATSGVLGVQTGRGTSMGATFTVTAGGSGGAGGSYSTAPSVWIDGFSPGAGRPDTVVTLRGQFGTPTSTPSVEFSGPYGTLVDADVSAFTQTSITATVPIGSLPGPISVHTQGVTATGAKPFDVWQGDLSAFMKVANPNAQAGDYCNNLSGHYVQPVRWGNHEYFWNGSMWRVPLYRDGSIGAAISLGGLPGRTYVSYPALAVVGNWIFVVSGWSNNGVVSTIWRAAINPDGSLGAWQVAGNMTYPRHIHRCAAYGNVFWVFPGAYSGYIEKFTVDTSTGALTGHDVYNSNLYGYTASSGYHMYGYTLLQTGQAAIMVGGYHNYYGYMSKMSIYWLNQEGGNNQTYQYTSTDLPFTSYYGAGVFNSSGFNSGMPDLYIFGGYNGSTWNNTGVCRVAYYDSSIGYLASATSLAATPWAGGYSSSFMNGGTAYMGSAYDGSQWNTAWLATTVKPDRSLGTWQKLQINGGPTNAAGAMIGNRLYSFGGWSVPWSTPNGSAVSTTRCITANTDGGLTGATTGPSLNTARNCPVAAVANGYVYVLGGNDGNNNALASIERAQINADNSIGNFMTLPQTLAYPRWSHATFVKDGYLYVAGGYGGNQNGGAGVTQVERFDLNTDGTLGNRVTLASGLPAGAGTHGSAAVILKDKVYLLGANQWTNGGNAPSGSNLESLGGPTGAVYMATFNADHTLTPFTQCTNQLAVAVHGASTVRIGNYVYSIGGNTAWGPTNVVQRAFVNPNGALGDWSVYKTGGYDPLDMPYYQPCSIGYVNGSNLYIVNPQVVASTSAGVTTGFGWSTIH